ncbi:MAG: hypothetical protein AAF682_13480 [Planctomycetota bacterium]
MRLALFLTVSLVVGPVAPAIHANLASARTAGPVAPLATGEDAARGPSFPVESASDALLAELDRELLAPAGAVQVERRAGQLVSVSVLAAPLVSAPGTAAIAQVGHVYAPSAGEWVRMAGVSLDVDFEASATHATLRLEIERDGAHPLSPWGGWVLEEQATARFATSLWHLGTLVSGANGPALLEASLETFSRTLRVTDAEGRTKALSGADVTWGQLLDAPSGDAPPSPPSGGGGSDPGGFNFCMAVCLAALGLSVEPQALLCLTLGIIACSIGGAEDFEGCLAAVFLGCGILIAITDLENVLACLLLCLGQ